MMEQARQEQNAVKDLIIEESNSTRMEENELACLMFNMQIDE